MPAWTHFPGCTYKRFVYLLPSSLNCKHFYTNNWQQPMQWNKKKDIGRQVKTWYQDHVTEN